MGNKQLSPRKVLTHPLSRCLHYFQTSSFAAVMIIAATSQKTCTVVVVLLIPLLIRLLHISVVWVGQCSHVWERNHSWRGDRGDTTREAIFKRVNEASSSAKSYKCQSAVNTCLRRCRVSQQMNLHKRTTRRGIDEIWKHLLIVFSTFFSRDIWRWTELDIHYPGCVQHKAELL